MGTEVCRGRRLWLGKASGILVRWLRGGWNRKGRSPSG